MLSLFTVDGGLVSSLLAVGNTMVGIALFLVMAGYAYGQFQDLSFPLANKALGVLAIVFGIFFLALGVWGFCMFVVMGTIAFAIMVCVVVGFVVGKKVVNYAMTISWYCFKLGEKLQEWSS